MILKKIKSLFTKKRPRVKQQLIITQDEEQITIEGFIGNQAYTAKELSIQLRGCEKSIRIKNEKDDNHFKFTFNLLENEDLLIMDEGIYNKALIVAVHESELTEKQIMNLKTKESTVIDIEEKIYYYPLRLGRFKETITNKLKSMNTEEQTARLYKTVKGNVSLAINHIVEQANKIQVDYLKSRKHEIRFGGKLFTRTDKVENVELLLIGRESNVQTRLPLSLHHMVEETEKRFGLNRYTYNATIDMNNLLKNSKVKDDVYDPYLEVQFENIEEKVLIRVGKPRFKARYRIKSCSGERDGKVFALSPYYTFRQFNLSLQVDSFEKEAYAYLRKMMRFPFFTRMSNIHKDVWLIGEKPHKGQDTGYHFFKYMRENHPEKNVYYVIEEESPELRNVEPYGNVVFFRSIEHIKLTFIATRIIGSHHADYLFPIRTTEFAKKIKAKKVFLQHGVMGTKNMVANYGKNAPGFDTDLFIVSSEFEKEMIVNDFGYSEEEVVVTGLSRFDSLLAGDLPVKRQLLIIPTWREWLMREDLFLESEYFVRYKELVNNDELHAMATRHNFEIVFCLHPNMQRYLHYFKDSPIRIINQAEVNVQDLLKESAMMITDYSSVAFDFSFLEKPIVYYQFDRRRFIGARGSHLELDADLPGDILYELEDVLAVTNEYAEREFVMSAKNKQRASKLLTYKDRRSSERIYKTVALEIKNKPIQKKVMESELYKVIFNRYRKSKYYYPSMKLLYNVARRVLPVDNKLILFESGIGRQYTDSPRVIYEEIVNRNLDYKKVWIYNKNIRFKDSKNTIRISRFSPSYFYYLAKARFWVNNQNFPTYITKRKETTYLQTWHGTPLKKMLHDIEYVFGRGEDYLERVSNAIKNWDYLISPSTYASNAFRSAFKFGGEIIETGYPRNDIFYDTNREESVERIKSHLIIPPDKKVILYAPTFRDNQTKKDNKFTFDIRMDLHQMQEALGDDYIVLLRMHVVVKNKVNIDEELKDFVLDVSNYPDMQELLLITDVLITDYSSVMFDFANTKKPMLFFTFDLETYRDNVRGFYIDFEKEAPGPFVRTTAEIINSIERIEDIQQEYGQKYDAFYNKFCRLDDGNAGKRVVDLLLAEMNKK